jgi:hypothetical protein
MDALQLLLDRGADLEMKDGHGWTALMVARKFEQSDVEGVLLRAGARDPGALCCVVWCGVCYCLLCTSTQWFGCTYQLRLSWTDEGGFVSRRQQLPESEACLAACLPACPLVPTQLLLSRPGPCTLPPVCCAADKGKSILDQSSRLPRDKPAARSGGTPAAPAVHAAAASAASAASAGSVASSPAAASEVDSAVSGGLPCRCCWRQAGRFLHWNCCRLLPPQALLNREVDNQLIPSPVAVCGTDRDIQAASVGSNVGDYADSQYQGSGTEQGSNTGAALSGLLPCHLSRWSTA